MRDLSALLQATADALRELEFLAPNSPNVDVLNDELEKWIGVDMTPEERAYVLEEWMKDVEDPELEEGLGNALYTLNEAEAWPQILEMDPKTAVMCWRLIEKLREEALPEECVL